MKNKLTDLKLDIWAACFVVLAGIAAACFVVLAGISDACMRMEGKVSVLHEVQSATIIELDKIVSLLSSEDQR